MRLVVQSSQARDTQTHEGAKEYFRSCNGRASHFQAPTMVRLSDESTVLETTEIIKDFFRDMKSTIQEGYAYSKVDKAELGVS